MDVTPYLEKQYGPQPCWELVADVLAAECGGIDVTYRTVNRSIREMANAFRLEIHRSAHGYEQVLAPADFTIVLLGRNPKLGVHHCGIWIDGKVLHAEPGLTYHEALSAVQARYTVCEFWARA